MARLAAGVRAALRPPRLLRPTSAGWGFFALLLGVTFAALNTGNNLLYLVLALMLAFLTLSGVLSEASLRGICVERHLPREWIAERAGRVVLEIGNAQRRLAAHAVMVEDIAAGPGPARPAPIGSAVALRVGPRGVQRRSYSHVPRDRGELHFEGFRVSTRFPFALFVKSLWIQARASALIYPALVPTSAPVAERARRSGDTASGRRPQAAQVSGLRPFAPGDPARRIHWTASWRRAQLLAREAEGEATGEVEVVLPQAAGAPGPAFERAVQRAASEAEAGLRAGLRVGLRSGATRIAPGEGAAHRARLLSHLARVEPSEERGS
jgi:uncharacterized protein (DUF58 family)